MKTSVYLPPCVLSRFHAAAASSTGPKSTAPISVLSVMPSVRVAKTMMAGSVKEEERVRNEGRRWLFDGGRASVSKNPPLFVTVDARCWIALRKGLDGYDFEDINWT